MMDSNRGYLMVGDRKEPLPNAKSLATFSHPDSNLRSGERQPAVEGIAPDKSTTRTGPAVIHHHLRHITYGSLDM